MVDLSIIIVSYNTRQILKECLDSIFKNPPGKYSFEAIVVDNASSDGSADAISNLKSQISNLKLITNKENVGFAKGNNMGLKHAEGSFILFLNSDTVMKPETLDIMMDFMKRHEEVGAATCKVVLPNGMFDDASHRGFPTPWNAITHFSGLTKLFPRSRLFSGYSLGFKGFETTHEIDSCAGAFMLVRRKAGEQLGWWDEDFFWYGEDIDFCYRLRQKNWKIYYVPTVSILHYKGVSGGIKKSSEYVSTASEETRKKATLARFEAMRIFYRKHYQKKYPKIVTWGVLQGIAIKQSAALRSL